MTFVLGDTNHLAEHNRLLSANTYIVPNPVVGVDNAAAIQAVIDQCANANGGRVLFGPHVYRASGLIARSKVHLVGQGSATRLFADANMTDPAMIYTEQGEPCDDFWVTDMHLDGNSGNQSQAVTGILFNNGGGGGNFKRNRIQRTRVRNTSGHGIEVGSSPVSMWLDHLVIYNCTLNGLKLSTYSDSFISNIDIAQSGLSGFRASGLYSVGLENIKVWFSDLHGFEVDNARNSTFMGMQSQDNVGHGFKWKTTQGNKAPFWGNSLSFLSNGDNKFDEGYSGLVLDGVVGARIQASVNPAGHGDQTETVRIPDYGIVFANGATDNIIDLIHWDMRIAATSGDTTGNTLRVVGGASD